MKKAHRVLVCVTTQRSCARLIQTGHELASEHKMPLSVVHVVAENQNFFNDPCEGDALEVLFQASKEFGAQMAVIKAADVARALVQQARQMDASFIVLGEASPDSRSDILGLLRKKLPRVIFTVVPAYKEEA